MYDLKPCNFQLDRKEFQKLFDIGLDNEFLNKQNTGNKAEIHKWSASHYKGNNQQNEVQPTNYKKIFAAYN